jgi:hypothetical protein
MVLGIYIGFGRAIINIVVGKGNTMDENNALRSFGREIDVVINENESRRRIKLNEFFLFG